LPLTSAYPAGSFADSAEAAATLKLRTGDADALDYYSSHGRIRCGSLQAMTEAAYDRWKADMTAGQTTIMTAATSASVTTLAARARADRVAAGQVELAALPSSAPAGYDGTHHEPRGAGRSHPAELDVFPWPPASRRPSRPGLARPHFNRRGMARSTFHNHRWP
jgi:hypothetical protein